MNIVTYLIQKGQFQGYLNFEMSNFSNLLWFSFCVFGIKSIIPSIRIGKAITKNNFRNFSWNGQNIQRRCSSSIWSLWSFWTIISKHWVRKQYQSIQDLWNQTSVLRKSKSWLEINKRKKKPENPFKKTITSQIETV